MSAPSNARSWINRSVLGIVLATFLSDFGHEAATAVLPLYLAALSLGPAALGIIEGVADFVVSLSKLVGGYVGHRLRRKLPWTAAGYAVTAIACAAIGLVEGIVAILILRSLAWSARGFRGPLRDHLLADAVEKTHYGRAYGLERAGDMLGAVAGPLLAALLVWLGIGHRGVLLWSVIPGLCAAAAIFLLTRERIDPVPKPVAALVARPRFPRTFWIFLVGVLLFGLGDFSRTFLILLAAQALGGEAADVPRMLSLAVLLYALHNLISAVAALGIGQLADRRPKLTLLRIGYLIGVGTNLLLALVGGSLGWVIAAIVLSGIYIAAEETLEKAAAAELLPRELRSLGFGLLASANAVGDLGASLYVGFLWQAGYAELAFGIAASVGLAGVLWMTLALRRTD